MRKKNVQKDNNFMISIEKITETWRNLHSCENLSAKSQFFRGSEVQEMYKISKKI